MNDNRYVNESIKCSVKSCVHQNSERGYCSLDAITVGTHEPHPTKCQCVDCESFRPAQ